MTIPVKINKYLFRRFPPETSFCSTRAFCSGSGQSRLFSSSTIFPGFQMQCCVLLPSCGVSNSDITAFAGPVESVLLFFNTTCHLKHILTIANFWNNIIQFLSFISWYCFITVWNVQASYDCNRNISATDLQINWSAINLFLFISTVRWKLTKCKIFKA